MKCRTFVAVEIIQHINFMIMKNKLLSIIARNFAFILCACLFHGCESEKEDMLLMESEMINSVEFEDVIIASYTLQTSLEDIMKGCNGKDLNPKSRKELFLKLWSEGDISKKLDNLNNTKKVLQRRHPDFFKLSKEQKESCIRTCIKRSKRVNTAKLRLGISPFQTRGNDNRVESYSSKKEVLNYTSEWVKDSNYVEAAVFVHQNGKYTFLTTDSNTIRSAMFPLGRSSVGVHVNVGQDSLSPLTEVWHTHRDTIKYSTEDSLAAEKYPELNWGIIYKDSVHIFYYAK